MITMLTLSSSVTRITQGWTRAGKDVWDINFVPRNRLDFGIGGDQTQHVLWRMDNYPITRLHPEVAVVLIGTNNTQNTPEEIAAGVKAILDKTQAMYPGIKIILNSIMPNRRADSLMMSANTILRQYADGKNIFYLDLVPLPFRAEGCKDHGKDDVEDRGTDTDVCHYSAAQVAR
jgi:hypothetical protein